MPEKPTYDEIYERISRHLSEKDSADRHDVAIAWEGYIAALLEWGMLTPHDHDELRKLLPETSSKAVYEIFVGFPEDDEQTTT